VPAVVEGMYDRQTADEIVALGKNRASDNGFVRTQMAADQLQARAKLRERLLPDVDDWVKKRAGARVEAIAKPSTITGGFTAFAPAPEHPIAAPAMPVSTPSTPATPEPTPVNTVVSPEPKETTTPEPLSAAKIASQLMPNAIPDASPTVEPVSTPMPTPVTSPSPVESAVPAGSPYSPENPAGIPPSPTASPEPSPSIQKRVVAKHSATPKPEPTPTPTPTPKPKTLIGKIFDNLRKASEGAPKATPSPTVRYWATPKPKISGKATPTPSTTNRWWGDGN